MGEPERDEDAYTKLIVERAAAIVERDAAIAERDLALNRLQALAAGDRRAASRWATPGEPLIVTNAATSPSVRRRWATPWCSLE